MTVPVKKVSSGIDSLTGFSNGKTKNKRAASGVVEKRKLKIEI